MIKSRNYITLSSRVPRTIFRQPQVTNVLIEYASIARGSKQDTVPAEGGRGPRSVRKISRGSSEMSSWSVLTHKKKGWLASWKAGAGHLSLRDCQLGRGRAGPVSWRRGANEHRCIVKHTITCVRLVRRSETTCTLAFAVSLTDRPIGACSTREDRRVLSRDLHALSIWQVNKNIKKKKQEKKIASMKCSMASLEEWWSFAPRIFVEYSRSLRNSARSHAIGGGRYFQDR